MTNIDNVANANPARLEPLETRRQARQTAVQARPDARPQDRVDLSAEARAANAPIRTELVERVRAEIASGEYLTDARLDAALDGLLQDIAD
ncbi:MAG: flagellar biosynthesis anti-sigma factor FlgM [Planctomycetota bacterium]